MTPSRIDGFSFTCLRMHLICITALYYIAHLYDANTCCNLDTGSVAEPTLPPASLSVERMSAFVKPSVYMSIDAFTRVHFRIDHHNSDTCLLTTICTT